MADSSPLASKWNARYAYSGAALPAPAEVLLRGEAFLPPRGKALDLACGRGANAVWLSARGLEVSAWDISETAIESLRERPAARNVQALVRDVVKQPPEAASFDVIVVSRFLDRSLCPSLEQALRPNGLILYQTFTRGLSNPDYLLKPGELPTLFPSLTVCWYHEPSDSDNAAADGSGDREAMLVARRQENIA